jgi:hypothetical protein
MIERKRDLILNVLWSNMEGLRGKTVHVSRGQLSATRHEWSLSLQY